MNVFTSPSHCGVKLQFFMQTDPPALYTSER